MNNAAQVPSSVTASPASPNPIPGAGNLSDTQKLALFSQVLDSLDQADVQLNPPAPTSTGAKEAAEANTSPDLSPFDVGAIQYVEQEKSPEIPVEVEGYLQKVEDIADQKPPEIFIADGTQESDTATYPSRPVIVLPITEEIEDAGLKKNHTFSIRWLVEWSQKIIKMFAGKVIYRQEKV